MSNLIVEIPDVISRFQCEMLIRDFNRNQDKQKHTLIHKSHGTMDFMEARLNDFGWANTFLEILKPYVKRYLELTGLPEYAFPTEYGFESPRMKHYAPETGRFEHHVDVGDYATARRFLVMLVYLNDGFEGGETDFPYHGIKVKPEAGKLVIFPAGFTHPHAGLPTSNGAKYIASTYLHYL